MENPAPSLEATFSTFPCTVPDVIYQSLTKPAKPPISITQRYVEEKCATTTWRRGSTSEVAVQSSGAKVAQNHILTLADLEWSNECSAKWRQSTENNGHHLTCLQAQVPLHHHAPWIFDFNLPPKTVSGTCRNWQHVQKISGSRVQKLDKQQTPNLLPGTYWDGSQSTSAKPLQPQSSRVGQEVEIQWNERKLFRDN